MKRRLFILQLLLSLCTFMVMAANEGNKTSPFGGKRVLFIGIDGLRPDALQKAIAGGMTPNLKQLVDGGTVSWSAYAGGPKGTPAEQPTISGAGWTSFYTGTWTDRHGVINNSSPAYDHPLAVSSYQSKRSPTFAVRLKEKVAGASVASIVSWDWIEDYLIPAAPDAFSFHEKGIGANYAERDASVVDKTRAYLAANDPDVLMLHLDQVDGAGHASGFSADNPDYLKALVKVDEHIGTVMTAIRARADYASEQWLTVVSTDHGGLATKHGGQSADERDIFMLVHGPGVEAGKVSDRAVGQPALAPTIFRFFGVEIAPDWRWAETSFGLSEAK